MAIIFVQTAQTMNASIDNTALISAIIGGIIAIAGAIIVWWYQQRIELKNIAKGIFFDVSNLEVRFNEFIATHENFNLWAQKYAKEQGTKVDRGYIVSPLPFYDDKGLFYVFSKDIARFDSKLSSELYEFYVKVSYIEKMRGRLEMFQERENSLNKLTDFEKNITKVDYEYMVTSIKEALDLILIIKHDLKEKYHIT